MDNVGAEVGQKMRSAIKAKLLELDCYVDDELPDYIMVMVANRRTKVQMNEDLSLFLSSKTSTFVEWLHIVLKKLKEVTVTNPEVYKKVAKRKSNDEDIKIKKEKYKKYNDNVKKESDKHSSSEKNKVTENEDQDTKNDDFDVPLLSEVNSTEKDLEEIEAKIKNVKSRLGLVVDEDIDEETLKIKLEKAKSELESNSQQREVVLDTQEEIDHSPTRTSDSDENVSYTPEKPRRHSPIIFEKEEESTAKMSPKKNSVLSRLGKRVSSTSESESKKRKLSFSEESSFSRYTSRSSSSRDERRYRRERSDRNEKANRRRSGERRSSRNRRDSSGSDEYHSRSEKSVHSRIGVMSKIHVPEKSVEDHEIEDELKTREVRSMVQVKPRTLPSDATQPNKNLLLKAVAEAHKSVSQARVGNLQGYVRKSEDSNDEVPITRKLSHREKIKLRNLILAQVSREDSDSDGEDKDNEYVPKPLRKGVSHGLPEYVPSSRKSIDESLEKEQMAVKPRLSAKARLEARKSPSPIVFKKVSTKASTKIGVPESLHVVHPPPSLKTQERCKYWPSCRQGDKCEFIHPSTVCEVFPNCKYGDKCLFLHPSCKFGAACTKRDCPYGHATAPIKSPAAPPQTCKFHPNCANISCPFYHPKMCRFGKYCKNQSECSFSHPSVVNKTSLTWRSK